MIGEQPAALRWDRFQLYAARVHFLCYEAEPESMESAEYRTDEMAAYMALLNPTGKPFLPNLRELYWIDRDTPSLANYSQFVLPFLPPKLDVLSLKLTHDTSLCDSLALRNCQVKALHLEFTDWNQAEEPSALNLIRSVTDMETFMTSQSCLTMAMLEGLVKQPKLRHIETVNKGPLLNRSPSPVRFHLMVTQLPPLKSLSCEMHTCDAIQAMQDAPGHFVLIETLQLDFFHFPSISTPVEVLREIGEVCTAIENLRLVFSASSPNFEPIPGSALSLLFKCHKLKDLGLKDSHPITVIPSDVEKMGRAWPDLVRLSLSPYPRLSDGVTPGSSWEIMRAFAKSLLRLEKLHLYFNPDMVPPLGGGVQFQSLRRLAVGISCVPDLRAERLARFLAEVCPSNCELSYTEYGPNEAKNAVDWPKVAALYDSFRAGDALKEEPILHGEAM